MFYTNADEALKTARLLAKRAAHSVEIFAIPDAQGVMQQDLQKLLSAVGNQYTLICDEKTIPSRDWLKLAYQSWLANAKDFLIFDNSQLQQAGKPLQHSYIFARTSAIMGTLEQETPAEFTSTLAMLNQHIEQGASNQKAIVNFLYRFDKSDYNTNSFTPDSAIHVIDVKSLDNTKRQFDQKICVVMPCINIMAGMQTANLLQSRAGINADYLIVNDTKRQGFIKTLNQAAKATNAEFVVYLAEDALPGEDWLKIAIQQIEQHGAGLLAFNCGKWHGRVAAFGLVRTAWIKPFYNGDILFDGYKSHRADNEITILAKADSKFVYCQESILFENDPFKDLKKSEAELSNFSKADKELFKNRYNEVLPSMVDKTKLIELYDSYFNQKALLKPFSIS
jgi:hypothetical protein